MPSSGVNRVDPTATEWYLTTIAPNGSQSVQSWSGVAGFSSLETSKSWVRTPNFWALRRSGSVLPENNFSYQRKERSTGVYYFEGERWHNGNREIRQMWVPKSTLHNMPDHGVTLSAFDLNNRLVQQARSSNFSLPVTLVEARQTIDFVSETARTLASAIFNLRRGNLVGAGRALGFVPTRSQRDRFNRRYGRNPVTTASNYWLQYQYAWKPMLNDAKNAAEALAEAVSRRGDTMTSTIRASSRRTFTRAYQNYSLTVSPAFKANALLDVRLSRRATWTFRPRAADLPGLFGLTNPFEVVWEIIPFSFVADWFLPIGNYLSSLDAPLRFEHVSGSTGYRSNETISYSVTSGGFIDGLTLPCSGGGSHTVVNLFVQREKMNSIPSPSLSDLTWDPRLNATRLTSAVALLWQQASRLNR